MIIRTKFLLIFLLTAILPLILFTAFIFNAAQTIITTETTGNVQTIAALKASRLKVTAANYITQATRVASRPTLLQLVQRYNQTGSRQAQLDIQTTLQTYQSTHEEVYAISVVSTKGIIVASTDPHLIGIRSATGTSASFVQGDGGLPLLNISRQLEQNEQPIGTLSFLDNGDQFNQVIQDYTGLGKSGDIILAKYNADGTIDFSPGRFSVHDSTQEQLKVQLAARSVANILVSHHNGSGTADVEGKPFFFTIYNLSGYNAALITKIDTSEAFSGVTQLLDSVLVFGLIFMLLVIMVILFFVHSITGPIANLSAVAKKASDGNLEEHALVLSGDEIGNLASSFNHMLDELRASKVDLEQKIHERTVALEVANKELESFTYSVSHDLRAPLRAIDGFSKILTEDYSGKLGKDGQHLIDTIVTNTQQMANLIDDLLTFSRLGRQEVKTQVVDMHALAQEVYDEQKSYNPKRAITLTLHRLPAAQVDHSLIRQVWVNLISNAMKYTKYKKQATIEIGATLKDSRVVYYVRDNGAGFDMAYVDKLFGVFQRLHDQQQFEGTGVGLANVKRIVERHGGKVWAEGKVDQGATMYFSVPKAKK